MEMSIMQKGLQRAVCILLLVLEQTAVFKKVTGLGHLIAIKLNH